MPSGRLSRQDSPLAHASIAPPLAVPATLAAWRRRRRGIRQTLEELLGRLPPRPRTPRAVVVSRAVHPQFVIECLEIDNGAGECLPAHLIVPRAPSSSGRRPAVLYHHWHGNQYEVGKQSLLEREYTPVAPGPHLARMGYIVLAIDAPGFGERCGRGPGGPDERGREEEASLSKFNLWVGRTLWGMMVRDDRVALDYLLSRRDVDPARVGAAGMSMGATRTWWLMALDDRVTAGVAVACMTRYTDLLRARQLSAHGIYYYVPGLLAHFDSEAIIGCIAPRPVLFLTGDRDAGSPASGVRQIASTARELYGLHGAGGRFQSVLYPGVGHEYTPDMWTRTVKWFARHIPADEPVSAARRTGART